MAQLLQPHQRLAGYEIYELVGKGGMGEVYRALQVSMDRVVALKVLSPRLVKGDPNFAKRFVEEARSAGRLNHPNIIAVHDVGKAPLPGAGDGEEADYFSMEYVDGETVKEIIVRAGACRGELVEEVMTAMAEALVYAEKMGVVHRDIKPDNIMISSSGMVKLADLGLAQQLGEPEEAVGDKSSPSGRRVMGTPMYMSPEQARAIAVDHRSDQYSLGATLYHMLTGQPPFSGDSAKAIMRAHVYDPVPDPHAVSAKVTDGWRQVCMRLMEKNPGERYENALELRQQVRQVIDRRGAAGVSSVSRRVRPNRSTSCRDMVPETAPSSAMPRLVFTVIGVVVVVAGALLALKLTLGVGRSRMAPPSAVEPAPGQQAGKDLVAKAQALVAQLPAQNDQAIAKLDAEINDSEWSAPAREVLAAEKVRRQGQLNQQAQRQAQDAQTQRLAGAEKAIAGGDLKRAATLLAEAAAQPDLLASGQRQLADKLHAALVPAQARFAKEVQQTDKAEALDRLAERIASTPFDGDASTKLQQAIAARRQELAKAVASVASAAEEEQQWSNLATVVEEFRFTTKYSEFGQALADAIGRFPPVLRDQLKPLVALGSLADQGESLVRPYIRGKGPVKTIVIGNEQRVVRLATLNDQEVGYYSLSAPNDVRKAPRKAAAIPYGELLDEAVGQSTLPADIRAELPSIALSLLWMWKPAEARAALARIATDPLAKALALVEDRTKPLPLAGAVWRDGEQVVVEYDFTGKEKALLRDFFGDRLAFSERGLQWQTDKQLPQGVAPQEAQLPTLRWKGVLRPPFRTVAQLVLSREGKSVLFGVSSGPSYLRICFTLPGDGSVVVSNAYTEGGKMKLEQMPMPLIFPPQPGSVLPLRVELSVAKDYTVEIFCQGRSLAKSTQLPKDNPLGVVIQVFQSSGKTSLELTNLKIAGVSE